MHDWTLLTLLFDWQTATVTISFRASHAKAASLIANGVSHLDVPRLNEWGRSVSVNKVHGPVDNGRGEQRLQIEMQSGDVIAISATSFVLPNDMIGKVQPLETVVDGK
ncbi:MAG TPA: hypothetical protein VHY35_24370 [Stellaceae bacterium]|jgi:hypothetical protein|nr:hypothetical protein [Stellaceae bacterium]